MRGKEKCVPSRNRLNIKFNHRANTKPIRSEQTTHEIPKQSRSVKYTN